ncbi:hypothetical protein E1285_19990 [Actinomadura sp. 7K507]|nr:hypothetical protein E1285_19990 [Actinomadura sp. 7K507]
MRIPQGCGHWHPHELRHSGASLILAQGTPLRVVSEILGTRPSRSPKTSMDIYPSTTRGRRLRR